MRILIVGCGSIGKRHLRAFKNIKGVEVIPCDPRKEVLKEIAENYNLAEVYNAVSKNLPGLTKVSVFDILWWSYLKAKRLRESREKNDIKWATIQWQL